MAITPMMMFCFGLEAGIALAIVLSVIRGRK